MTVTPQADRFLSQGLHCAAEWRRLAGVERPPVVILAHGFAAERSFRLPAFADRFVAAGFACFLFDYRCFGESEGEPRHWVDPDRHLADWRAALAHVQSRSDVDSARIVLWGSSFSGGHVLALAAERPAIAAVISQVPHVDGLATAAGMKVSQLLKGTLAGLRDALGSLVGKPYYAPVVGRPGSFAAMTTEEVWDGWHAIVPPDSTWENRVLARVFLKIAFYSPGRHADRITVPVLLTAADADSITPADAAEKVARRIADCEFHRLPTNHFQPYVGEAFEQNVGLQLDFLRRRVLSPGPTTG
jgi:pimeloyl-ACP methyl ester carboxylesterase